MSVEVRRVEVTDVSWISAQLKAFSSFAGFDGKFFPDEEYAAQGLANLINGQVFLVALVDGARAGFIAGAVTPHPFNPSVRVLSEMFWWVAPEYRRTRAGFLLLREFEIAGRRVADWIVVGLEHRSAVRDANLVKRGFRPMERTFLLEVARV